MATAAEKAAKNFNRSHGTFTVNSADSSKLDIVKTETETITTANKITQLQAESDRITELVEVLGEEKLLIDAAIADLS